jgi:Ser-tRNA(Ala) deacylase AlaX
MPTKRLYYFDAKKLEHFATVIAITERTVELNETIFHPQGGGQPSDVGTIQNIPVIKVTDCGEDNGIQHELASAPDFKVGDKVSLLVEQEPRLLFTRLHSAGHLLAHIAENKFPSLKNPRGHHFPGEARVVFDYTDLPSKEEVSKSLLEALKNAIHENTPVISSWSPESGRTITMDGSTAPCGGTHVSSLGEIGKVEFRKVEAKKGTLKLSYNVF